MYSFGDGGIMIGYIKELLSTFELPRLKAWRPGVSAAEGESVVCGTEVLRALRTGALSSASADFSKAGEYHRGAKMANLTGEMKLRGLTYDAYTHRYLGDYLRFVRDYDGMDLMGMYNCFAGEQPFNLSLKVTDPARPLWSASFDSSDASSKIFMVPVRYWQTYTIAIDCGLPVEIVAGFYSNAQVYGSEEKAFSYFSTYRKVRASRFQTPFAYGGVADPTALFSFRTDRRFYEQEKNLVLFVKVPATCSSGLVVLEGDRTKDAELCFGVGTSLRVRRWIRAKDEGGELNPKAEYPTRPQLLWMDSGESHPFADRLIEYLLEAPVCPTDPIGEDVVRVQGKLLKMAMTNECLVGYKLGLSGVWDDGIRRDLYKIALAKGIADSKFDVTGYCDKDAEGALGAYDYE